MVDNASPHRGKDSVRRTKEAIPSAILVHTPAHASWLEQVDIYFLLLQGMAFSPPSREMESRIRLYEELAHENPKPFDWEFTKFSLLDLLQRMAK